MACRQEHRICAHPCVEAAVVFQHLASGRLSLASEKKYKKSAGSRLRTCILACLLKLLLNLALFRDQIATSSVR